jgi:tetratricopeptide (TPR) repeat protein
VNPKLLEHGAVRLLLLLVVIGLCLWIITATARLGFSRIFIKYSLVTRNLSVAERAVQMAPTDPETHRARAAVLTLSQAPAESVEELERAISLRPSDYTQWVELGLVRDQMGDSAGALGAFDEAVKRAPFYALPRWQRGNVLLRLGQYDSAFDDLNRAAQSNPEFIPNLIDLAWNLSHGDPKVVQQLVQVNSKTAHTAMAKFFASHGKPQEAMTELQYAGGDDEDTRRQLIASMLAKGSFAEAYQVWSAADRLEAGGSQAGPQILDGGFEGTLNFDQGGFSWIIPSRLQAATVSQDSSQPHSGSKDLRIEFAGDSSPGAGLVSQLILVEPLRHYKINFAARSQDIVTGGLPIVTITDASGDRKALGQSAPLSKGTTNWNVMSFDFTAQPTTKAVVLSLQRQGCTTSPCPIFGAISLDSFSIEQSK